jgi:hypothetical protein
MAAAVSGKSQTGETIGIAWDCSCANSSLLVSLPVSAGKKAFRKTLASMAKGPGILIAAYQKGFPYCFALPASSG